MPCRVGDPRAVPRYEALHFFRSGRVGVLRSTRRPERGVSKGTPRTERGARARSAARRLSAGGHDRRAIPGW